MTWFVYILRCADGTLYTGISTDVNKRKRQHNGEIAGGAKYTRTRRPVALLWVSEPRDRSGAARLEATIKAMDKWRKEEFVHNMTKQ